MTVFSVKYEHISSIIGGTYVSAGCERQPTEFAGRNGNFFLQAHEVKWDGLEHSFTSVVEKDHGRIETRNIRVVHDIDWLPKKSSWKNLTSIIEVTSIREFVDGGKSESATRLYISSRRDTASNFAKWVRGHWRVENNCHWIADIIFREDQAQTDVGHSAENMSIFRRLAMNMAAIADPERGTASIRRAAAFGAGYLKGILGKIFLREDVKSF